MLLKYFLSDFEIIIVIIIIIIIYYVCFYRTDNTVPVSQCHCFTVVLGV